MPIVRATFQTEQGVKVYLDNVSVSVAEPNVTLPVLTCKVTDNGVKLTWDDRQASKNSTYYVYRQFDEKEGYKKLGETTVPEYSDNSLIHGVPFTYLVITSYSIHYTKLYEYGF